MTESAKKLPEQSVVFIFFTDLEWVNVSEPISLAYHCIDKVVVLDFWTYCCINCFHVLPDLAHLEKLYKVEDGLVVVSLNIIIKYYSLFRGNKAC